MFDTPLPALHGNWVDLVILFVVVFYLIGGWNRGFILSVLDLGGFILSFVFSLKLYSFFGLLLVNNFSLPRGIANAAGFLIAGILAEFIFSVSISFIFGKVYPLVLYKLRGRSKKSAELLTRADTVLGVIPAAGEAIVFIAFVLTLLISLPIQGSIKKDIVSSKIGGGLVNRTQAIERQLNAIFGEAVNETLTFLTINANPSSSEHVNLGFFQPDGTVDESGETTMLTLVNQERTSRGLRELTVSPALRSLGRDYAKDMFARGYFSHYNPEGQSPFDRMNQKGIRFSVAGENLALAPNVYLAHQGLMNSPGHRANILNPDYGHVGIGAIDGGIYGEMFVQEFTD